MTNKIDESSHQSAMAAAVEEDPTLKTVEEITSQDYKYGFVTDIEMDTAPPGLNEDIIRFISKKKNEPQFLLDFGREGDDLFGERSRRHIVGRTADRGVGGILRERASLGQQRVNFGLVENVSHQNSVKRPHTQSSDSREMAHLIALH